MKKVVIALGIMVVTYIVLFTIPVGPRTIIYESVAEQGPMDHDVVVVEDNPRGDYLVRDNKLYLRTQETRGALVLVTFVSQTRWTAQKIQELRRAHPELEPYWPEPQAPDGGVQWVRRYR